MLWEHEPQASVSTAFSRSSKLSRVFLQLDRNTEYMFSISITCRKNHDEKKENNLLTLIIKMYILRFVRAIITSTVRASSVSIELYKHDF